MSESSRDNLRKHFPRAIVVWLILMAVEFGHGAARAIWLTPVVGEFRSRQIGVVTGSILILGVTFLTGRWLLGVSAKVLLLTGGLWLLLTLAFEFSVGHWVFGRACQDLAADYDPTQGGLLSFGMLVLLFSPLIAAKLRR